MANSNLRMTNLNPLEHASQFLAGRGRTDQGTQPSPATRSPARVTTSFPCPNIAEESYHVNAPVIFPVLQLEFWKLHGGDKLDGPTTFCIRSIFTAGRRNSSTHRKICTIWNKFSWYLLAPEAVHDTSLRRWMTASFERTLAEPVASHFVSDHKNPPIQCRHRLNVESKFIPMDRQIFPHHGSCVKLVMDKNQSFFNWQPGLLMLFLWFALWQKLPKNLRMKFSKDWFGLRILKEDSAK